MREPIDNEYFNWLCAKVLLKDGRMYHDLLKILYQTEFVWLLLFDRNRAADGIELRLDFRRETGTELDPDWESQPCSLLEIFISFAQRASFQTDTPVRDWFWIFMENLHLDQFRQVSGDDRIIIDEIIETFMWRTYDSHGNGGLFPITRATRDQREIEIWWQFCDYVKDRGLI